MYNRFLHLSTVLLTGGLDLSSHLNPTNQNGYKVVILDSLYNSSKNKLDHIKNVLRLFNRFRWELFLSRC